MVDLLFHSLLERRGAGVRLKLDVQGQRGWKKSLDVDEQGEEVGMKIRHFSWTSYVYCPIVYM